MSLGFLVFDFNPISPHEQQPVSGEKTRTVLRSKALGRDLLHTGEPSSLRASCSHTCVCMLARLYSPRLAAGARLTRLGTWKAWCRLRGFASCTSSVRLLFSPGRRLPVCSHCDVLPRPFQISNRSGAGLTHLIDALGKDASRRGRPVYMVGTANAGKSSFLNKILSKARSESTRERETEYSTAQGPAKVRAAVSLL